MSAITRVRILTKELIFSIRNEIDLQQLENIRIREISTSDAYIALCYYNEKEMTRLIHIYESEQHIVSIEEDGADSQVLIACSIDDMLGSLLSLTGDTKVNNESLDIPASIIVGLLTSITSDEAVIFLKVYTRVTDEFAIRFVDDIYNVNSQEHYIAYSKNKSEVSFVKFIKGENHIWRITPSRTEGNVVIKQIPPDIYRTSVASFLKEMIR